ncbi:MAG: potassium transporter Kup [Myxococcales bacterium]|nr:potassium transporter Kup [Myxococcales bacterium]
MNASATADVAPQRREFLVLCLGALGVVYGDIGTSPLYALRECFAGEHRLAVTPANVLGILSLVFWSLTLVVSVKYLAYVLRADNQGEGGVLALMALALDAKRSAVVIALGLFGAALLYGDGMITPAISVLSSVEGLELVTPGAAQWVVPITLAILVLLFAAQRFGTAKVGTVFGPVMILWFATLGVLGVFNIGKHPDVLFALSPHHAVGFFRGHGLAGFLVLGSVFLVVTGGEALYADMGHFGAGPIRRTWLLFVWPALMSNYLGQGALLLASPMAADSPFFKLAPGWALVPLVVLAAAATIIASQAMISGAFSLTRQAMMLGFWPRVRVLHTSADQIGQIYVPSTNWMLMAATVGLVLGFRTSSALAAAYGIAVTTTMVITALLAFVVARRRWGVSLGAALAATAAFLVVDLAFFSANAVKIGQGGWFPLVVGALVFFAMTTWKRGREVLGARIRSQIVPLEDFFELMRLERPERVPGPAVFMASNSQGTPPALMTNFLHNRVVHEQVLLLTVKITDRAREPDEARVEVEHLPMGFTRVVFNHGFMEQLDVPALLDARGLLSFSRDHTTYFLGRETVLAEGREGMSRARERVFAFMSRNSQGATALFSIPPDRVMEVGAQVAL